MEMNLLRIGLFIRCTNPESKTETAGDNPKRTVVHFYLRIYKMFGHYILFVLE